jgi:hypothetical protein
MLLVFAVINHNHLAVCNFDGVPYYDVSCWFLNMGIYYVVPDQYRYIIILLVAKYDVSCWLLNMGIYYSYI